MSVRVSTRGVRTSIGPRIARVSVGSGGTRVSSGLGPFFASTSVGGSRRRSTTRRTASARRSTGPSPAQLQRAQRAAERAQLEAERDERIAELNRLRRESTSVHLQEFPAAHPPEIPEPPELGYPWARAEAEAFHLRGIGRFARAERSAARARAVADATMYLAAEQQRLAAVHRELAAQAQAWWRDLVGNDEAVVCEAVNAAFADNPAAGCAVGLQDGVLSVVLRHPDLDALPTQTPGLTSAGRPTLTAMTRRDRMLWWLTILGSNVVATVKEALATAPGVSAVDLAAITRLPDTQRLGVIAVGRWSRRAVESTAWREPADALRFLDIGEDVRCSLSATATKVKPVDISGEPGLQALVDSAVDDGLDTATEPEPAPEPDDPYAVVAFEQWATGPGEPPAAPPAPPRESRELVPGQNVVLPEEAWADLVLEFAFGGADADLTLLLLGADQRVRDDTDFVFYNQPLGAQGAARLLGKDRGPDRTVERAALRLSALPPDVVRVVVSVNMAVDTGLTCGELTGAALAVLGPAAAYTVPTPSDPRVRAMVLAEIYRHSSDGRSVWKLKAVGQGWAEGLAALATAYGVDID